MKTYLFKILDAEFKAASAANRLIPMSEAQGLAPRFSVMGHSFFVFFTHDKQPLTKKMGYKPRPSRTAFSLS
jgi:hypothetical protein